MWPAPVYVCARCHAGRCPRARSRPPQGHVPSRPVVLGAQVCRSPSRLPLPTQADFSNGNSPVASPFVPGARGPVLRRISSCTCAVLVCVAGPNPVTFASPGSAPKPSTLSSSCARPQCQHIRARGPSACSRTTGLMASLTLRWQQNPPRRAVAPVGTGLSTRRNPLLSCARPASMGKRPSPEKEACRQKFQGPWQEG